MKVKTYPQALEVLERMRRIGLQPCLSALSILFRLLLGVGDYGNVWKFFRDMLKQGTRPSNITFNVLIHGFCKKGQIQTGESLFHLMIARVCWAGRPDEATGILEDMLQKGTDKLQEAEELIWYMREGEFSVNKFAFTVLIDGYFRSGDVTGAQRLRLCMKNFNTAPDAVAFSAFIDGLSKAGRIEEGYNVFLEMKIKGLVVKLSALRMINNGASMLEISDYLLHKSVEIKQG